MPFLRMDDATARLIINFACPVGLIVVIYDLTQALNHLQEPLIALSLLMIAILIVMWTVALTFTGTQGAVDRF